MTQKDARLLQARYNEVALRCRGCGWPRTAMGEDEGIAPQLPPIQDSGDASNPAERKCNLIRCELPSVEHVLVGLNAAHALARVGHEQSPWWNPIPTLGSNLKAIIDAFRLAITE